MVISITAKDLFCKKHISTGPAVDRVIARSGRDQIGRTRARDHFSRRCADDVVLQDLQAQGVRGRCAVDSDVGHIAVRSVGRGEDQGQALDVLEHIHTQCAATGAQITDLQSAIAEPGKSQQRVGTALERPSRTRIARQT